MIEDHCDYWMVNGNKLTNNWNKHYNCQLQSFVSCECSDSTQHHSTTQHNKKWPGESITNLQEHVRGWTLRWPLLWWTHCRLLLGHPPQWLLWLLVRHYRLKFQYNYNYMLSHLPLLYFSVWCRWSNLWHKHPNHANLTYCINCSYA